MTLSPELGDRYQEAKAHLEQLHALEKLVIALNELKKNSAFKQLIEQAYLSDAPLTYLNVATHARTKEERDSNLEKAMACNHLRSYLNTIEITGLDIKEQIERNKAFVESFETVT